MSTTHVVIACPSCRKDLKARREYVGRQVSCKHCGNTFTIRDPEASGTTAAPVGAEAGDALEAATTLKGAGSEVSNDLLASLVAERDRLKAELAELRAEPDRPRVESSEPVTDAEAVDSGAISRLEAELEQVRAERDRLAEGRREAEGQAERLRQSVHELERAAAETANAAGALEEARAAWDAERQSAQAQWEQERQALTAEAEERLAAERDRATAERQHAEEQLAGLRQRAEQAKTTFEAERGQYTAKIEDLRRKRNNYRESVAEAILERDALTAELQQLRADRKAADEAHQAEQERLLAAALDPDQETE